MFGKNKSKPKRSKYNNKKTEYNGVMYDSKKEASYAKTLDLLRKATGTEQVLDVKRQVPFPIEINGEHICKYLLDFKVTYPDRVEHVDVKGVKTSIYKLKKKMVEAYYPIKIIEV